MPMFNTAAYTAEIMSSALLLIFEGVGLLRQIGRMFSVATYAFAGKEELMP